MTIRDEEEAEKPLDPATERVRRKMVRLLAVSVGLMLIGVMAVLLTVVYKVTQPSGPSMAALDPDGAPIPLELPAGAEILDMALDGDRALLKIGEAGAETLVLVDLATGAVVARYRIGAP